MTISLHDDGAMILDLCSLSLDEHDFNKLSPKQMISIIDDEVLLVFDALIVWVRINKKSMKSTKKISVYK